MGRPRKDRPNKEELLQFDNKSKAAYHYGVSVRTIVRWLQFYQNYEPKKNFGANKLDVEKAIAIRGLYAAGWHIKALAKKYDVTFSTISRVIHNITHKNVPHEIATVTMVYNPH